MVNTLINRVVEDLLIRGRAVAFHDELLTVREVDLVSLRHLLHRYDVIAAGRTTTTDFALKECHGVIDRHARFRGGHLAILKASRKLLDEYNVLIRHRTLECTEVRLRQEGNQLISDCVEVLRVL